jgi:hypothetical protein
MSVAQTRRDSYSMTIIELNMECRPAKPCDIKHGDLCLATTRDGSGNDKIEFVLVGDHDPDQTRHRYAYDADVPGSAFYLQEVRAHRIMGSEKCNTPRGRSEEVF